MLHRWNARRGRASFAVVLAMILVIGLVAAGCGSGDTTETSAVTSEGGEASASVQDVDLLIPLPIGIYMPGLILGRDKFWKDEGLNVTLLPTDGSPVVAQQLISGKADFGMITADSLYLADVQGADLRGVSLWTHDDAALLSVPVDSPVQSVADLEGEAIGVTAAGDGAIPLVKVVLGESGLQEGDYELPVIGPGGPAAAQALKSGRVAAYAHGISDVGGMEAVAKVKLRSIMPEEYVGLPGNVLGLSQKVLDDPAQKEIARKLAQGWIDAAQFLVDSPDEAYKILCDAVPEQCQDQATAEAIIARATLSAGPVEGDQAGVIDLDKAQTLVDAFVTDKSLDVATVFPQDVFAEQ